MWLYGCRCMSSQGHGQIVTSIRWMESGNVRMSTYSYDHGRSCIRVGVRQSCRRSSRVACALLHADEVPHVQRRKELADAGIGSAAGRMPVLEAWSAHLEDRRAVLDQLAQVRIRRSQLAPQIGDELAVAGPVAQHFGREGLANDELGEAGEFRELREDLLGAAPDADDGMWAGVAQVMCDDETLYLEFVEGDLAENFKICA
ncbi:hypothetical protein PHLGIDRAFT_292667 [Phlebiopsis gigantea 11061_1 CR5-6]|uniref:Uncharacterized protein n=1 Tax=Phlebiopsis gigantea (strain 11061_1 CR5-6) TaxID=745531 RepID=A0A0C3S0H2_PHLG1|nr:hypothetical protein PHLGIDRAFT_292667 [Phlebiopsis gigantea 11061_1 CR5-6]